MSPDRSAARFGLARGGRRSDLASGKCDNISEPAARDNCEKRAAKRLQEALVLCDKQDGLRQTVCQRVGGGTYEPEIDPANFSDAIDNPYFPLKPGRTFIYEGQTADGFEHLRFAVTHQTRVNPRCYLRGSA